MAALLKTIRLQRVFSLSINLLKSQDIAVNQVRYFKAKWVKPTLFELKRRKDIEDDRNGGPKIFHRSTFLDWNYDAELYAFKNRIEEQIDDVLLRTALTHKSYIEEEANKLRKLGIEPNLKLKDNGDLAARGEILLSRYIYGYLRAVFTRVPEEMINAMHNHLMGNDVLAHVAKHIGMGDIILCADFPCADDTSAKSFQAIVASIEESCGEERARIFVQDLVLTQLYGKDVNELWNPSNPVGVLNSILEKDGKSEIEYRLIRKTGINTILASYHVGIYSQKVFISSGTGESLEIAQEMAAREGLKSLFHTNDAMNALPFGRQLKNIQSKIIELENRPNVPLHEWASNKFSASL